MDASFSSGCSVNPIKLHIAESSEEEKIKEKGQDSAAQLSIGEQISQICDTWENPTGKCRRFFLQPSERHETKAF